MFCFTCHFKCFQTRPRWINFTVYLHHPSIRGCIYNIKSIISLQMDPFFPHRTKEHPSPSPQTRRPHHVLGNDCTRISSPSLVSSLVHPVLGPSPFCKVCSQLILLSVSHFGKLCRDESKETPRECYFWIRSWQKGRTGPLERQVCAEMCTVQARPSTVVSQKDWPTVKEMLVVRTLVDVLMDRSSPCWLISTTGLEAAATAIFLKKMLTPGAHTNTTAVGSALVQELFHLLWIKTRSTQAEFLLNGTV